MNEARSVLETCGRDAGYGGVPLAKGPLSAKGGTEVRGAKERESPRMVWWHNAVEE